MEDVAALQAQFAWNPQLSYEQFFDDFAACCYGRPWAAEMGVIHRELEALGPRYTGGLGQTECGPFCWFDNGKKPKPENLAKLAALRARIAAVRQSMTEKKAGAGLERIDWLLTTIDWLTRYDAAAVVLCKGGAVDRLLFEAESKRSAGDHAAARALAVKAAERFNNCGLADAMQTYPWKMTTCGEWGALATINVKSYAAYEQIAQRIKGLGGEPAADSHTLPQPQSPRIVMRTPPSIVEPGKPVEVAAIVIAKQPEVTLRYRRPGQAEWLSAAMRNTFRRAWIGVIPAAAVGREGIEYVVEARDAEGQMAFAPCGYPGLVWSASGLELPAPAREIKWACPSELLGQATIVMAECELPLSRSPHCDYAARKRKDRRASSCQPSAGSAAEPLRASEPGEPRWGQPPGRRRNHRNRSKPEQRLRSSSTSSRSSNACSRRGR